MRNANEERVRKEAEHRDRGDARPSTPFELLKVDQLLCSLRRIRDFNLTTASLAVSMNGFRTGAYPFWGSNQGKG